MELFTKTFKNFQPLTYFTKSSTLEIELDSKFAAKKSFAKKDELMEWYFERNM